MSYLSIFHTIFIENNDLSIYHYLAFESLFNLNIDKLYIHYYNIPTECRNYLRTKIRQKIKKSSETGVRLNFCFRPKISLGINAWRTKR